MDWCAGLPAKCSTCPHWRGGACTLSGRMRNPLTGCTSCAYRRGISCLFPGWAQVLPFAICGAAVERPATDPGRSPEPSSAPSPVPFRELNPGVEQALIGGTRSGRYVWLPTATGFRLHNPPYRGSWARSVPLEYLVECPPATETPVLLLRDRLRDNECRYRIGPKLLEVIEVTRPRTVFDEALDLLVENVRPEEKEEPK